MKFAILITTSYITNSGCSVHSLVQEFDHEAMAIEAVDIVNGQKYIPGRSGYSPTAEVHAKALFRGVSEDLARVAERAKS
jgi:hypothetical protein